MIKTVSLETAKLLKEAGFNHYTEYSWVGQYDEEPLLYRISQDRNSYFDEYYCSWYPIKGGYSVWIAPTKDELLEELPDGLIIYKTESGYEIKINGGEATTRKDVDLPRGLQVDDSSPFIKDESLPEALAQMWLWLKKERLA